MQSDYERIHSLERFCNKAFDLRNSYIISLIDEAYKRNLSQEVVELFLETSREDSKELLEYARATNFKFGDDDMNKKEIKQHEEEQHKEE